MSITQDSISTRKRAEGAFLGSAVGDALGASLEFMNPDSIIKEHGGPLTEIVGGGCWGVRPGQVTDDTEMALCLARSLELVGDYHPYAAVFQYIQWLNTDPFDVGATCRYTLNAARNGIPAELAAKQFHIHSGGRSAGNGSLMRQAPLAVKYKDDLSALADAIALDTKLTHFDDLATETGVFFSRQVARLMQDPSAELETPEHLGVRQYFDLPLSEIQEIAMLQMGFCLTGFAIAMYALRNFESFEEGLIWAVNLGGDADTNGAIVGTILGAKFGVDSIPERWLSQLEPAEEIRHLVSEMLAEETPETIGI